jgi:hypothetical protein
MDSIVCGLNRLRTSTFMAERIAVNIVMGNIVMVNIGCGQNRLRRFSFTDKHFYGRSRLRMISGCRLDKIARQLAYLKIR